MEIATQQNHTCNGRRQEEMDFSISWRIPFVVNAQYAGMLKALAHAEVQAFLPD
jgi:hypothetical protein